MCSLNFWFTAAKKSANTHIIVYVLNIPYIFCGYQTQMKNLRSHNCTAKFREGWKFHFPNPTNISKALNVTWFCSTVTRELSCNWSIISKWNTLGVKIVQQSLGMDGKSIFPIPHLQYVTWYGSTVTRELSCNWSIVSRKLPVYPATCSTYVTIIKGENLSWFSGSALQN